MQKKYILVIDAYFEFKTKMREKLARLKVVIDYIFRDEPKFKGESIRIE